jgi:archaellum component FlaC
MVSEMKDSQERIKKICQLIEERLKKYNFYVENLALVFRKLDGISSFMKTTLVDIEKLEIKFEHSSEEFFILAEEINSLVAWYSNFSTSYDELIFEIHRRHKEIERQHQIVQSYTKNLQLFWQSNFLLQILFPL